MKRPNSIFVALALMSGVGLGLEVYAISRPGETTHVAPAPTPPQLEPEGSGPQHLAEISARNAPPRPAAQPVVPPSPIDSGAGGRPLFVAPDAETVRREADEMAFATLQLNEDARAAIRRINDSYAAHVNALRNGDPLNQRDPGNNAALPEARRVALRQALGLEAANRFEGAEQTAAKRLHNRYRWQSLHGIAPGSATGPQSAQQSP